MSLLSRFIAAQIGRGAALPSHPAKDAAERARAFLPAVWTARRRAGRPRLWHLLRGPLFYSSRTRFRCPDAHSPRVGRPANVVVSTPLAHFISAGRVLRSAVVCFSACRAGMRRVYFAFARQRRGGGQFHSNRRGRRARNDLASAAPRASGSSARSSANHGTQGALPRVALLIVAGIYGDGASPAV